MDEIDAGKTISQDDLKLITDDVGDDAVSDDKDESSTQGNRERADTLFFDDDVGDADDDDLPGRSDDAKKTDDRKADDKKAVASKGDEKKDEAEDEGDEKEKAEEKSSDWRATLIEKVLSKQGGKLSADKLEKRREALARELGRYSTAEDYMLAGMAAREKIRSGEYRKSKLPDDATDKEVAAWRKENGIPETAENYEIPKVPGYQWQKTDDPYIESFKAEAHTANLSQDQMNAVTRWYAATIANQQDEYLQRLDEMDTQDREETRDTLRAELGAAEFKTSISLASRLLKDSEVIPQTLSSKFLVARFQDDQGNHRRLIDDAEMARFLISMARDTYGDAALVNGDASGLANNRKKEIEEVMKTDINEYYRKGLDKELLDINKREEASANRRRR
jgi:hypothetical protein